jgi:hypothetical protein
MRALYILVVNLKLYVTISILLCSNLALGSEQNICPVNEEIAEDMRIPETEFTKERAGSASELLVGIIDGSITTYETFNLYNAQKLVTGYILKKNALDAKSADKEFKIREFCSFMEKSAWWYD